MPQPKPRSKIHVQPSAPSKPLKRSNKFPSKTVQPSPGKKRKPSPLTDGVDLPALPRKKKPISTVYKQTTPVLPVEPPKTPQTEENPVSIPKTIEAQESNPIPGQVELKTVEAQKPIEKTNTGQFTSETSREARKLRTDYGKKLPPLACDNCSFAAQCPQFKQGYECAFTGIISFTKLESLEDIKHAQMRIIEANMTTAELGLIQQRLAGGVIDAMTSSRLDAAFEQLAEFRRNEIAQIGKPQDTLTLKGPGIIERLFGSLAKLTAEEMNTKKVEVLEVKAVVVDDSKVAEKIKSDKEVELDEIIEKFDEI